MNSLLLALQAIAILCGPRVQNGATQEQRQQVKQCQVEMLKCTQSKQGTVENNLAQCVGETK